MLSRDPKFIALAQEAMLSYRESSGGQLLCVCPYCDKEKLYINNETGKYICFTCDNNKGHYLKLFEELLGRKIYSTSKNSDRLEYIPLEISNNDIQENVSIELPDDFISFDFTKKQYNKYSDFYEYLNKRKITIDMARHFNIMFSYHKKRIIFPVLENGILIGYQGRTIIDATPKLLTGPTGIFKKSQALLNYDNVKDKDYISIVEGPIDACKAYKNNPVALFGKDMSNYQYGMIRNLKKLDRIYIILDPEETKKIDEVYKKFSPFYKCKKIILPKGYDCGDYSSEQIQKIIGE